MKTLKIYIAFMLAIIINMNIPTVNASASFIKGEGCISSSDDTSTGDTSSDKDHMISMSPNLKEPISSPINHSNINIKSPLFLSEDESYTSSSFSSNFNNTVSSSLSSNSSNDFSDNISRISSIPTALDSVGVSSSYSGNSIQAINPMYETIIAPNHSMRVPLPHIGSHTV